MPTHLPIAERFTRAFRDGSARRRRFYIEVRRAAAFLRDRRRRAIVRGAAAARYRLSDKRGVLVVAAGAFPEAAAVVGEAHAALQAFDGSPARPGKITKRFLVNVLRPDALTLASPLMRFALDEEVLEIVSRYLGLAPLLTAVRVFHSDTIDGVPQSSQLYHCDGDDVRQVKIFVYCTDVDAQSGPLTIVDAAATAAVLKQHEYAFGQRLRDEEVYAVAGRAAEEPILGPAGTVVFVDTSRCLHFGSRVAPGATPRLVAMLQYSTPYSFMLPVRYRAAAPYRHLIQPSLTPLQRLVLGE